ncbi:hypothetical protein QVD17_00425 [Tagetes erecta]|uniref:Uncharacterized protein n=1 Tax=Tagetes erecta TaxID=13708 RepID=A0AAD8L8R7_TARER|nr:hypothetical protein QVD17_00425 [Tagetes erecta]
MPDMLVDLSTGVLRADPRFEILSPLKKKKKKKKKDSIFFFIRSSSSCPNQDTHLRSDHRSHPSNNRSEFL